jgi:hypothetical protein
MGEASNCTERGLPSLLTEQGLLTLKANIDIGHTIYLLMKIQTLVAALRFGSFVALRVSSHQPCCIVQRDASIKLTRRPTRKW